MAIVTIVNVLFVMAVLVVVLVFNAILEESQFDPPHNILTCN